MISETKTFGPILLKIVACSWSNIKIDFKTNADPNCTTCKEVGKQLRIGNALQQQSPQATAFQRSFWNGKRGGEGSFIFYL